MDFQELERRLHLYFDAKPEERTAAEWISLYDAVFELCSSQWEEEVFCVFCRTLERILRQNPDSPCDDMRQLSRLFSYLDRFWIPLRLLPPEVIPIGNGRRIKLAPLPQLMIDIASEMYPDVQWEAEMQPRKRRVVQDE